MDAKIPTVAELHDLVILPSDNETHIYNLEQCHADLQAKVVELEGELNEALSESNSLQIQLLDLKGQYEGKVCGLCNYLERSACYEQREEAEKQVGGLLEAMREVIEDGVGQATGGEQCPHGKYRWDDCENCIVGHLQKAIANTKQGK